MNRFRQETGQSVPRLVVVIVGLVLVYLALSASEGPGQDPVPTALQLAVVFLGADVALMAWFRLDQRVARWWRGMTRPDNPYRSKIITPR